MHFLCKNNAIVGNGDTDGVPLLILPCQQLFCQGVLHLRAQCPPQRTGAIGLHILKFTEEKEQEKARIKTEKEILKNLKSDGRKKGIKISEPEENDEDFVEW